MQTYGKVIFGIIVVTVLLAIEIVLLHRSPPVSPKSMAEISEAAVRSTTASFLAFGDINLGRAVGQKIIKLDVDYPFRQYSIREDSSDIVFANLECQISDQKGETGHPKYNLIFTAPPEAITTLKNSGIGILSTANNHAVDYGIDALKETIDHLRKANIPFVGTSKVKENLFTPLKFEKNKIKFAIFGVTAFVNMTFKGWRDHVATEDTVRLLQEIEKVRDSVDVIILSYHGGAEYVDRPSTNVTRFADWAVRNNVDIFLGHHPHVSYGVMEKNGKYIVHSLGNFIFYQPQHYWTQRSYGVKFLISKNDTATSVSIERFIPIDVSMQTRRLTDSVEIVKLFDRTQKLSNFDLSTYWN